MTPLCKGVVGRVGNGLGKDKVVSGTAVRNAAAGGCGGADLVQAAGATQMVGAMAAVEEGCAQLAVQEERARIRRGAMAAVRNDAFARKIEKLVDV
jgi:hypothetical protein